MVLDDANFSKNYKLSKVLAIQNPSHDFRRYLIVMTDTTNPSAPEVWFTRCTFCNNTPWKSFPLKNCLKRNWGEKFAYCVKLILKRNLVEQKYVTNWNKKTANAGVSALKDIVKEDKIVYTEHLTDVTSNMLLAHIITQYFSNATVTIIGKKPTLNVLLTEFSKNQEFMFDIITTRPAYEYFISNLLKRTPPNLLQYLRSTVSKTNLVSYWCIFGANGCCERNFVKTALV